MKKIRIKRKPFAALFLGAILLALIYMGAFTQGGYVDTAHSEYCYVLGNHHGNIERRNMNIYDTAEECPKELKHLKE